MIKDKLYIIKNLKSKEIDKISSGKNDPERISVINPSIINRSSTIKTLNINKSKDLLNKDSTQNNIISKDSTQNNIISRNKEGKESLIAKNIKLPHKRRSYKSKTKAKQNSVISNFNTFESSEVKRINLEGKNIKSESNKKTYYNNKTNNYIINNLNITDVRERNTETEKDNKNDKKTKKY